DIISASTRSTVRVRSPRATELAALLAQPEVTVSNVDKDVLEIVGVTAAEIGDQAARAGLPLHELSTLDGSLEEAYMALTQNEVEYRTGGTAGTAPEPDPSTLQEASR
ncbi:MAG: ABC transporter ATP-binding protein, partial [Cryobacterium sp.]